MKAPQPATPAQIVAGIGGALLILVGLIGLAVNSSFDTGAALSTDKFIVFPVNGWDDLIPGVAFGLVLVAAAPWRVIARLACRWIGLAYLVLLIAGLVDGHDVWGFLPAGTADDLIRAFSVVLLWWAAAASKQRRDVIAQNRALVLPGDDPTRVVGPGSGHVGGPRAISPRIDRRLPVKQHS